MSGNTIELAIELTNEVVKEVSFDVMDGAKGPQGDTGPQGDSGGLPVNGNVGSLIWGCLFGAYGKEYGDTVELSGIVMPPDVYILPGRFGNSAADFSIETDDGPTDSDSLGYIVTTGTWGLCSSMYKVSSGPEDPTVKRLGLWLRVA